MKPTKRQRRLYSAKVLALLLLAGGLVSALPAEEMVIDLSKLGTEHPGFRIAGIYPHNWWGRSVSGAGDVNGDGLADLIVGSAGSPPGGDMHAGQSCVVFGRKEGGPIDLALLSADGFRIDGINMDDNSGNSVSGIGDVNGDGLADLVVGALFGGERTGESYVVFGKKDGVTVKLKALGSGGFRILGVDSGDEAGHSVSGAGDVNGDGLADLMVGAPNADSARGPWTGEAYVVFGKRDCEPVDLATLETGGFRIEGIDYEDETGSSVSGAGDVNGDGLSDLIVGAPSADPGEDRYAGESYVVFGKKDGASVDLSSIGEGGFRIEGIDRYDWSGMSVSGAGDVNGDGLADLAVGSPNADAGGDYNAGETYVIFGKKDGSTVDLAALGTSGFRIKGIDPDDNSGWSVAGAGDVDGDGLADLLIGAFRADTVGGVAAGASFVVRGKKDGTAVDLAALDSSGFRIDGIQANDRSGRSVSGAGDVNGDGLADLVVSADYADPAGRDDAGEAYVIFAQAAPATRATYRAAALPGDAPRIAIGITGDGSNDGTPDSRCWIHFADGSGPGLNGSSMQIVELIRTDTEVAGALDPESTANVVWHLSTDRAGWTSAALQFRYTDAEIDGLDVGALRLYCSDSIAGPWTELSAGFTALPARNVIGITVTELDRYFAIGVNPTLAQSHFTETPEGWTFAVPTPPFSASMEGTHSAPSGALLSTTHDNGNSFGFWESPLISLSPISVGEDLLYRATYTVSSDLEDPSMSPTMRLRLSSVDQHRSDIVTATSMGTASISPGIVPRDYTALHFGPAEQMRLAFDMLSFDFQDAANATFALHGVRLERLNLDGFEQNGNSIVVDPLADASAWSTGYDGTGSIAAPAEFLASDQGLLIRGESPAVTQEAPAYTQPVIFGFWTTTLTAPAATDGLYRVRWTIGSDAASRMAVPTFRLRFNDESLQFGSLVVIDSTSDTARVPVTGQDETYDQWFLLPPEVAGHDWLLSFDYLYADTSPNDDPTTGLWLRRVEVRKYQ